MVWIVRTMSMWLKTRDCTARGSSESEYRDEKKIDLASLLRIHEFTLNIGTGLIDLRVNYCFGMFPYSNPPDT